MAEAFRLLQALVGDESAFGESSTSFDYKLRLEPGSSANLTQERIANASVLHRLCDQEESIIGHREGNISLNMKWQGHGGTAAGALTETWQQRLLGDLL